VRLDDRASVASHIQPSKRRRRLLDISEHLAEEVFVLRRTHSQTRLRHELSERHWRFELILLAQQMRLRFRENDFQRCVIERHVMAQ
jgi:hypothetical protein